MYIYRCRACLGPPICESTWCRCRQLIFITTQSGEQALEIADTLSRTGAMDVVVIDSVAALVPRAELEGEMGDSHMALQARLMSQALRKMTGTLAKSDTLMIFINQIRSKVGVIFGSPEVTAGGNALKFYASVRLDIRKRENKIWKWNEQGGCWQCYQSKGSKEQNGTTVPRSAIRYDVWQRICRIGELIDLGLQCGVLKQTGSWIALTNSDGEASLDPLPPLRRKRRQKLYWKLMQNCTRTSTTGSRRR